MFSSTRVITAILGVLTLAGSAWAQPLGAFRWQQQPYCNVLTLNVIGEGGNYTLDGTDDLCGAGQKAGVSGTAYPNPDGTIGLSVTIVGPPGGAAHLTATINLVTLGGTWFDSNGGTGSFTFTPGPGTGGSARPAMLGTPTRATYTYDLEPGAISPPIPVPHEIPVTLVGNQLVGGYRGVGQASLLSVPGPGGFIEWVGLHSPQGAAITQGFSSVVGTLIVAIDWSHCTRVEVAGTPGSGEIRVNNTCGAHRRGVITLTY